MGDWIGKAVLKISTQEVGGIVGDDNLGMGRVLTAKFRNREEKFTLWNVGPTPRLNYAYFLGGDPKLNRWYNFGDVEPGREKGPMPKNDLAKIRGYAKPSDFSWV